MHGQVKTAAQFLHLLNRFQALACLLGQALRIGHHEIRIGLVMAAAHAPAQLVQLREAKFIGAADDDGVGAGHVNARLNDGGAKQDIVLLPHKFAHHALQLPLGHLAMRHDDASFGQDVLQALAAVFNRLDLVVQKINLPAALQFT